MGILRVSISNGFKTTKKFWSDQLYRKIIKCVSKPRFLYLETKY